MRELPLKDRLHLVWLEAAQARFPEPKEFTEMLAQEEATTFIRLSA